MTIKRKHSQNWREAYTANRAAEHYGKENFSCLECGFWQYWQV